MPPASKAWARIPATKPPQKGRLRVNSGANLDYESKSTYSITFHAQEKNSVNAVLLDISYNIFIVLTDVNEPPGKPTVTVANNTTTPTTKLDVSWTAPTMTGKPAIDDYDVQYRKTGDSTWTSHSFTGTGTTTTLSSLEAGKKYDVQVRANNAETDNTNTPTTDDSPWSDTANAITQSAAVTRSVAENTAAASNVGAAVTMTPGSYTIAHSLDGTDKDKFTIESSSGQIKVKTGNVPDYETTTSYSVTVKNRGVRHGQLEQRAQRHRHLHRPGHHQRNRRERAAAQDGCAHAGRWHGPRQRNLTHRGRRRRRRR